MKKVLQTNMRERLFSKLLIVERNKIDGANKQQILYTLYVGESNFIILGKIIKNISLVEYDIQFFICNNKTTQCTFFTFYKVEYDIHIFIYNNKPTKYTFFF